MAAPVSRVSPSGAYVPETDRKERPVSESSAIVGATSPGLLDARTVADLARTQALGIKPWMAKLQKNLPDLPADTCSNAEPENVVTTHLKWDVTPDFDKKQLVATATYTYNNKVADNDRLVLDISNLEIESVTVNGHGTAVSIIPSTAKNRPDALVIVIPPEKGLGEVVIKYRTTPDSKSVYWIDKECTHGKQHPLVYTLFETNEGASAIPGQHTPQVRLTYEVNAHTGSPDLMALSSVTNNPRVRNETGDYMGLRMGRAVPLYLLSLHVGNVSFRGYEADPRTGVYGEDGMIDEVFGAFKDLPKIMEKAEEFCGPYNWGTYSVDLLSWAFPYMAMEHPCNSTFGQICLERPYVVPHELAHSWTGNDITNCNWRQFFWNEGATEFAEYHICEKMWGTDYAAMSFMYTLKEMKGAMDEYREKRPDILRLCQETDDFEFTRIPYAKGALFFFMLKNAMGENDFNQFFKDYMKVFFQNTMSDDRFLVFLQQWLLNEKGIGQEGFDKFMEEHKVMEWLYGTELPSNAPLFQSKLMDMVETQKACVLRRKPVDVELIRSWNIFTQVAFLSLMIDSVTPEELAYLDQQMHFSESTSMSIREEWSRLCASAGYLPLHIRKYIGDYLIERNSAHKANQIGKALSKTLIGRAVIADILARGEGRLFPLTKEKLANTLRAK